MKTVVRHAALGLAVLLAATACSPAQMAAWLEQQGLEVPEDEETLETLADYADSWWSNFLTRLAEQARRAEEARRLAEARPKPGEFPWPWDELAFCESTNRWHINTGNGFYGGLQFVQSTWIAFGGQQYASYAHYAEPWQQVEIAKKVQAVQGWGAWPACTSRLGLR